MPSSSSLEPVFFTVEFTLCSPRSRFHLPFSHQVMALAYLDSLSSHDLVICTNGSVLFPFGIGGSGVLANCSLCGTEATLSFSARPVSSSFSVKICVILQTLRWSWQRQQVCPFSPPLHFLPQTLWQKPSLSTVLSSYNGSADTRFSRGTTQVMSWPDCERYFCPLQSLVVSFLLSTLFSDWRRALSSKFFNMLVPSVFTKELVLPRHARFVFSRLAATDTAFC